MQIIRNHKKNNVKKIDLLKIDTEGHELQVLKGAGSFKKQSKFHVNWNTQ